MDLKKILVLGVVLVLLGVGMGVGVSMMRRGAHAQPEEPKLEKKEPHPTVALDEFVVNLADVDEPRYLKISIVLEFEKELGESTLEAITPRMRDTIIAVLSRKYFHSLLTPAGKEKLKKELKEALNQVVQESKVTAVYFTAFAMQ